MAENLNIHRHPCFEAHVINTIKIINSIQKSVVYLMHPIMAILPHLTYSATSIWGVLYTHLFCSRISSRTRSTSRYNKNIGKSNQIKSSPWPALIPSLWTSLSFLPRMVGSLEPGRGVKMKRQQMGKTHQMVGLCSI